MRLVKTGPQNIVFQHFTQINMRCTSDKGILPDLNVNPKSALCVSD